MGTPARACRHSPSVWLSTASSNALPSPRPGLGLETPLERGSFRRSGPVPVLKRGCRRLMPSWSRCNPWEAAQVYPRANAADQKSGGARHRGEIAELVGVTVGSLQVSNSKNDLSKIRGRRTTNLDSSPIHIACRVLGRQPRPLSSKLASGRSLSSSRLAKKPHAGAASIDQLSPGQLVDAARERIALIEPAKLPQGSLTALVTRMSQCEERWMRGSSPCMTRRSLCELV
jgi:hypothetical protein